MIKANNIAELFNFIKKNRKSNTLNLNISKKGMGGLIDHEGQVEVISSIDENKKQIPNDLRWGVYIVIKAQNNYTKKCFKEYGMITDKSGNYSSIWRPYHYIGLAAQKYLIKNKIKFIMITMSENGILIVDKKSISHFKIKSKNIVDVSGAGDTVIAIASLCIYLSTSIPFLCNISNLAGKIVCQSSGVFPISKSKLYNEAKENELIKEA